MVVDWVEEVRGGEGRRWDCDSKMRVLGGEVDEGRHVGCYRLWMWWSLDLRPRMMRMRL